MKEIGSEYWEENIKIKDYNNLNFNLGKDIKYLMSGRTAIDYVLKNIKDNKKIVYMPNYCCKSMTTPFKDNGYKIKYYNVDVINNKYSINPNIKCSVFFAMSYFGYSCSNMDKYIIQMKEKGVIVIEDITHRLLQKQNHCKESNYLIASIRKWFPIYSGGIAVNVDNKFTVSTEEYIIDEEYLNTKKKAMKLKKEYILHDVDSKEEFMKLYNISNDRLKDYKNKKIDDDSLKILKSIDIDKIIKKRRENAKIIEKYLNNSKKIKIIYKLSEEDCPLFLPIIIEERNNIKKELVLNNIYCPTHWPNHNNFKNQIYDIELSLICDQRYEREDIIKYVKKMLRIVGE